MESRRPYALGALIGVVNGALVLYCCLWIAGVPELRHVSDWRGPLVAFLLAIGITAFSIIRQIQAVDRSYRTY